MRLAHSENPPAIPRGALTRSCSAFYVLQYVPRHYYLQVLRNRNTLKVVVMSATLEAEKFQGYFTDAPLMARHSKNPPNLPNPVYDSPSRAPFLSFIRQLRSVPTSLAPSNTGGAGCALVLAAAAEHAGGASSAHALAVCAVDTWRMHARSSASSSASTRRISYHASISP